MRSARATGAAARRPSAPTNAPRSPRSPGVGPPITGCRFRRWSRPKLAEYLVAKGWSTIISHQGLRLLLGQEGGSVQRVQSAEDLDRPERRDQEEPGARAVCDRHAPAAARPR